MAKKLGIKNTVILHHVESGALSIHSVIEETANMVEIDTGCLPLTDSRTYMNGSKGGLIYAFGVDFPAKVEAENLKNLRRSVTLKNIFNFERGGSIDLMKFMPWIIVALVIMFK